MANILCIATYIERLEMPLNYHPAVVPTVLPRIYNINRGQGVMICEAGTYMQPRYDHSVFFPIPSASCSSIHVYTHVHVCIVSYQRKTNLTILSMNQP